MSSALLALSLWMEKSEMFRHDYVHLQKILQLMKSSAESNLSDTDELSDSDMLSVKLDTLKR